MPENVTYLEGFIEYIEFKQPPVLVENEIFEIIAKIMTERLEPSLENDFEHAIYLEKKIGRVDHTNLTSWRRISHALLKLSKISEML